MYECTRLLGLTSNQTASNPVYPPQNLFSIKHAWKVFWLNLETKTTLWLRWGGGGGVIFENRCRISKFLTKFICNTSNFKIINGLTFLTSEKLIVCFDEQELD